MRSLAPGAELARSQAPSQIRLSLDAKPCSYPRRPPQAGPFTTLTNPELLAETRPSSCTRPVKFFLLLSAQWILPGLSDMVQSSTFSLSCFVSPFSCGLYVCIPLAVLQTHSVPGNNRDPGRAWGEPCWGPPLGPGTEHACNSQRPLNRCREPIPTYQV